MNYYTHTHTQGNLIRQTKIYFRSDQGVEMNSLVHAYVNKLLDRDT
jgi:hypothetical protein